MIWAFLYLLGQNCTYMSASWHGSIAMSSLLAFFSLFLTEFNWRTIVAVGLGWLSVAHVPEHRLKTSTRTFSCHASVRDHHLSMFFITELLLFVAVSCFVNIDDGAWWLWMLAVPVHVIYVILVDAANRISHRVRQDENLLARAFFLVYLTVLICSDLFFLTVSLIAYNRRQTLVSIGVLAAITLVTTYVAENFDVVQRFECLLLGRHHVYVSENVAPASRPVVASVVAAATVMTQDLQSV